MSQNSVAVNNNNKQHSPSENKENMNTTFSSSTKRRAPVLSPSLIEAAHKHDKQEHNTKTDTTHEEDTSVNANNKEIIRSSNKVIFFFK
jgi:hypothetical protein